MILYNLRIDADEFERYLQAATKVQEFLLDHRKMQIAMTYAMSTDVNGGCPILEKIASAWLINIKSADGIIWS